MLKCTRDRSSYWGCLHIGWQIKLKPHIRADLINGLHIHTSVENRGYFMVMLINGYIMRKSFSALCFTSHIKTRLRNDKNMHSYFYFIIVFHISMILPLEFLHFFGIRFISILNILCWKNISALASKISWSLYAILTTVYNGWFKALFLFHYHFKFLY